MENSTARPIKYFYCKQCKTTKPSFTHGDSGFGFSNYGMDKAGVKTCSECIGINEAKALTAALPGFKTTMYLSNGIIQNWPGTLKINPSFTKKGKHNIAGSRIDAWFTFSGNNFHGYQIGSNTEILHVRRIKNT